MATCRKRGQDAIFGRTWIGPATGTIYTAITEGLIYDRS